MRLSLPPKEDKTMDPKQNLIQRIIAHLNQTINNKAANQMTKDLYYDRAQVVHDMRTYGYKTVGEYARSRTNLFTILATAIFGNNY